MARKNQKAPWEPEEEIIWVSKTEMKTDMDALQKLGEELVGLKPSVLDKFPLSEDLAQAIKDAQRFKNEAKRRQLQYIGKIMRNIDPEPIQAALDKVRNKHSQATAELHKLEQLSPYLKHLHLPVHALVYPHLVNSQQLSNRWKWCPEDFPLLVLFHPSPVGWALHLWLSLQCLSP